MPGRTDLLRIVALGVVALTLGVIPGCSSRIYFNLFGIVKDASDGGLLEGVEISIKGRSDQRPGVDYTPETEPAQPVTTILDGQFRIKLSSIDRSIIAATPRWELVLSKDGYVTEVVDISPNPHKLPGSSPGQIRVIVYLRPEQGGKRK